MKKKTTLLQTFYSRYGHINPYVMSVIILGWSLVIAFVISLFLTTVCFAFTDADIWTGTDAVYMIHTDEAELTVTWDAVTGATYYNFEILWIDPDPPVRVAEGQSLNNSITLTRPRTGHLLIKVQSCDDAQCNPEWCYSMDKNCSVTYVDPDDPTQFVNVGWIIFWRPASPTGIGVK